MTEEQRKAIDSMSHYDLCRLWRFGVYENEPLLQGHCGSYLLLKLKEKGGITPEISKNLDG